MMEAGMSSLPIEIRIKTLNDQTFSLHVSRSISVRDLKTELQGTTHVPLQRQRLIYRGKLLRDGDVLSAYNVEDGHTVHLVARPERASLPDAMATTDPLHASSYRQRLARLDSSTSTSLAGMRRRLGMNTATVVPPVAPFSGLVDTGSSSSSILSEPEAESSVRESPLPSVEHLRQGLLTIQTLLSASDHRRRFHVGQWLDVKDTVNQWLEATVLDVTSAQVFVHYHGWPSRWDEWIDLDSARLAAFRTRTLHAATARHLSPEPVIPHPTSTGAATDLRSLLPPVHAALRDMLPLMESLASLCDASDGGGADERDLAATLAPLFDRMGRLLTDAAPGLEAMGGRMRPSSPSDDATFRELIAVRSPPLSTAAAALAPRRSIDVHIHAILAPSSSFGTPPAVSHDSQWHGRLELDGLHRWRELSERLGSFASTDRVHSGGPGIETSMPLLEDNDGTSSSSSLLLPSTLPELHATDTDGTSRRRTAASANMPTFLDVIRRTMHGLPRATAATSVDPLHVVDIDDAELAL
ncbi:Aste57867_9468 [Aphanomyces stellatus]|uniref:Aste57867_9468 protein n=1 Tax=Aphanomyces stellatus TaxID=120398 RepID=A0A485KN91_9STRA|nr:hypothetical protein As57867_009431 [Aphanomyces stellatus]VFT86347.1 Aste57867_9468 [Aphanomyces stellatus]